MTKIPKPFVGDEMSCLIYAKLMLCLFYVKLLLCLIYVIVMLYLIYVKLYHVPLSNVILISITPK